MTTPKPTEVVANLKCPTLYILHPYEPLHRFASSTSPFGFQASRWWLRQREFELLVSRAKKNNASLARQARIDLAICQTWGNKMDILVRATVRRNVDAWMGTPKKQRETAPNGIMLTLPGCHDIQQVFIPDITDPSGMLTFYGRTAISVEETKIMQSSHFWEAPVTRK